MRPVIAVLALCLLAPCAGAAAQSGDAGNATVTVYRCTDASGAQSLRDSPCPKGQKQQTREMVRPKDAPPKPPAPAPVTVPQPVPATSTRTVYLAPPRPMYECTTPDGETYTSENGDGNPRWAPLWTQGYLYAPGGVRGSGSFRPAGPLSAGLSTAFPSAPTTAPPSNHPPPRPGYGPVAAGGSWVRDQCAMLPPREACARLRDRREQIRTRFFNAQEKERDVLRKEERGINARLDDDCGGR